MVLLDWNQFINISIHKLYKICKNMLISYSGGYYDDVYVYLKVKA